MNRFQSALRAVTLAVAFTAAGTASAQGLYAGVGVTDTDLDTGLKLFVGAPISAPFGWEAQYTGFGSRTTFGVKTSAFALGASATATLPIQRNLSAFGKLGIHYVKVKNDFFGSDTSTELGVGIGLLWQVAPQWGLRVEWEHIDSDVLSFGVQMKF